MSTAVIERESTNLLEEVAELRRRLAAVEQEVSVLRAQAPPAEDWRVALKRAQDGWASMDPEFQAECLATFEEVRQRIREADGDA